MYKPEEIPGVHKTLGIVIEKADPEEMVLSLAVTEMHHQPMGILHGGVSVLLAESAASMGAFLNCDAAKEYPVGMEINANHIKSISQGKIIALGKPLHRGRSSQVWEVKITNEEGQVICVSRCTLSIIPIKK